MDDTGPILIDFDLPCMQCGYNLRGLAPEKTHCPQCGTDVADTIASAAAQPSEQMKALLERLQRQPFVAIAQAADTSVDAAMFVRDAVNNGKVMFKPRGWFGRQKELNAQEICAAVAWQASTYFNDPKEARELLHEWGVRSSEDVGRIVIAFMDAGWFPKQKLGEQDFQGLFTLDTLLQSSYKQP